MRARSLSALGSVVPCPSRKGLGRVSGDGGALAEGGARPQQPPLLGIFSEHGDSLPRRKYFVAKYFLKRETRSIARFSGASIGLSARRRLVHQSSTPMCVEVWYPRRSMDAYLFFQQLFAEESGCSSQMSVGAFIAPVNDV